MTNKELKALFEKHNGEYGKFSRVVNPLHPRPDLCAFLLLDRLVPDPGKDMVSAVTSDEFYLRTSVEELAKVAIEEDVITLCRCGVLYDGQYDCLAMFT